jgi:hypothetical protein
VPDNPPTYHQSACSPNVSTVNSVPLMRCFIKCSYGPSDLHVFSCSSPSCRERETGNAACFGIDHTEKPCFLFVGATAGQVTAWGISGSNVALGLCS